MAIVKGKCLWAKVQQPDTKFDPNGVWSIDLIPERAEDLEYFRSKGYKVKTTDKGEETVQFKRKVKRANGGENQKPKVVNAHKEPVESLIGNGSVVNVQYQEYSGTNSFGPYQGLELKGVQVLELVEYGEPDGAEFESYDEDSEF